LYKLQAPPIWIRPCMSHHVHIFKHHPSHNPPRRQCNEVKVKVKFTLGHEGPEAEQMYSSTLPSTSALDGGSCQRHASAALPRERPGTHWI